MAPEDGLPSHHRATQHKEKLVIGASSLGTVFRRDIDGLMQRSH